MAVDLSGWTLRYAAEGGLSKADSHCVIPFIYVKRTTKSVAWIHLGSFEPRQPAQEHIHLGYRALICGGGDIGYTEQSREHLRSGAHQYPRGLNRLLATLSLKHH